MDKGADINAMTAESARTREEQRAAELREYRERYLDWMNVTEFTRVKLNDEGEYVTYIEPRKKVTTKEREDTQAADVGTPTLKRKHVKSDYSVDTVYSSDSSKGSKSKKEEPTAKRPKYINLK